MKSSFYNYTLPELKDLFSNHNLHLSGPVKLYNWHYKQRKFNRCTEDLAKVSQSFILENLSFDLPVIDFVQLSDDRAVKFLFKLHDGKKVETVLIPSKKKYGICLSSQVGCAMKCSFCHTGLQGLERHLETHEIVGQLLAAQRWLTENRPDDDKIATIVFMGQGEPLHNFDSVRRACEIFHTQNGLCFALDRITISTAGYLPGLLRWKEEMPDVNIALSLHSINTDKRNELIPINARFPVQEVLEVVNAIPRTKKRFVIYEYLLARGFNDSESDAKSLGAALQGKRAFVNLIPFNPFPGAKYERPTLPEIQAFKATLDEFGVPSLVRITKGDKILAACGQLNSKEKI
ncbi:MAG: 23S rRNA (adenine(2503)-C(2))-methyltransferase RlmN [Bacteriovoracaceae bacterium]|nr:23S rRNA (adenine(2503)-C(2))-methyltransferase RlmN [Bacteriovoracaceae bacterium]